MNKIAQCSTTTLKDQCVTLDQLQRPLQDLRISVIDQCNLRCPYCMPAVTKPLLYQFLKTDELLTFEEIERIARQCAELGVRKIRLTGGEPLLKENLADLIHRLNQIEGIDNIALTTNGIYLSQYARVLKEAGLGRITVSVDTLNEEIFRILSGNRGSVRQVLEGIREAQRQGFSPIKINAVIQKNINEKDILDLARYFRGSDCIVRFIEFMDVGNANNWSCKAVVPSQDILNALDALFPLECTEPNYRGEVAQRYRYIDGQGEIGFVSSVSQPFCGDCTRLRLSADGTLYPCLFAGNGLPLRDCLRQGLEDSKLGEMISRFWRKREDHYSELRTSLQRQNIKREKVEMYKIGG
ncbi:MAG: GTP 3',8-cyclase MoaA [Candidatus Omnitrophota bacterium]